MDSGSAHWRWRRGSPVRWCGSRRRQAQTGVPIDADEPRPMPEHHKLPFEVDGNGVAWQNWRVSGHFSAFDRTLCDTTSDPRATGQSCPEGWSFRRKDDPTYGDSFFHANESYLAHMDFHDTLGLGADAPIYGSVNTDALEVFSPNLGRYVTPRVPYPLGFFPRSGNGRVDDPDAGWKGRGYWASFSTYATWHIEGGRGEGGDGVLGKVVKFQMRPDPLAR